MTATELGQRMDADEFGFWVARASLQEDRQKQEDLNQQVQRDLLTARTE